MATANVADLATVSAVKVVPADACASREGSKGAESAYGCARNEENVMVCGVGEALFYWLWKVSKRVLTLFGHQVLTFFFGCSIAVKSEELVLRPASLLHPRYLHLIDGAVV